MKIILKNKNLSASINSYGAYVEEFTSNNKPIFFPKLLIKIDDNLKTRGGMHPCLPNFGISDIEDLASHGYGRVSFWDVVEEDEKSVKFSLKGEKKYKDLISYIKYELDENSLITKLVMKNEGDNDLYIAPGFHPYFSVDENVKIKGINLEGVKLEDTFFVDTDNIEFNTNYNNIKIKSNNFKKYAIWTDYHGDYLCVEPCLNGPSFKKEINNPMLLRKGEEFKEEFRILISN